jgi:hypothetical protein
LLWLNDRCGRMAKLGVMVGGDGAFPPSAAGSVLSVTGRLIHWRQAIPAAVSPEVEALEGDHAGTYRVGGCVICVPELARGAASSVDDVDCLYMPLDGRTGLYIKVADDGHAIFGGPS